MNEVNINVNQVSELLNLGFFIPDYQRGYRWNRDLVEDLMDDIDNFFPERIDHNNRLTWYCLQPLVVKKCNKDTIQTYNLSDNRTWYEVIDGQQRLTTIFLIIHYLNQGYTKDRRRNLFEIQYATRPDLWENINQNLDNNKIIDDNIDLYHISNAYNKIHEWFQGKENTFDINEFESKVLHYTKFIWYEPENEDPITLFTRLNIGKIPLTNAELIKALFLNSSNFSDDDDEKIRLKQLEIANEWDRIEFELHKPDFWYFINQNENNASTRIEFIFDLMADKNNEDNYYTFRFFSKKFKNNTEKEVKNNWKEIKEFYQILEEWYIDREFYHKIGYLITTWEANIKDLINLYKNNDRDQFTDSLNKKIKNSFNSKLDKLEYGDNDIRKVLLLHNIQTILNNQNEDYRFLFDRFKQENWDVEHIHSVKDKKPKSEWHKKDWLKESLKFIQDENLEEEAHNLIQDFTEEFFDKVYEKILNHFSENEEHEEINDLSNLSLLDSRTNRGYGNAVFPVKRKTIIEKDKEGIFIPICTKNAFMKYHSDKVSQMSFWGQEDRENYMNNIIEVLKPYL